MDEVFGSDNFISLISFDKTSGTSSNYLATINDHIVWYGKNKADLKYRQLYKNKLIGEEGATQYVWFEDSEGNDRRITKEELANPQLIPSNGKVFAADNCTSMGKAKEEQPFEFNGKVYFPSGNAHWKPTYPQWMSNLSKRGRLKAIGNSLMYKRYFFDFPVIPLANVWSDTKLTGFTESKQYV